MDGAHIAIEALLKTWENKEPSDEIKNLIISKLTEYYKDLRIVLTGVWLQVDEKYRNIIIRWLTKANILFFMDIVSRSNVSHMWPERRAFWTKLYDEGEIDAAWVAFSSDAISHVERVKIASNNAILSYGRQTAGGTRKDTSLLIMKIGQCIVVDGSHSYRVHLFDAKAPRIPELFKLEYDCEEIRKITKSSQQEITHNGNWQSKVRTQLRYLS